uniref:Membrane-anchored junction protein isoform X4 n=1 Tax=Petromyzon marinus TaxID=7757 RepID=A0AAJ7UH77_PETMA|nr:membrane-anchored junction protein isoform X4 [Petromyzon marinus]
MRSSVTGYAVCVGMPLQPFSFPSPETRLFIVSGAVICKVKLQYGLASRDHWAALKAKPHIQDELEVAIRVALANEDDLKPFVTDSLSVFPYKHTWEAAGTMKFRERGVDLKSHPCMFIIYVEALDGSRVHENGMGSGNLASAVPDDVSETDCLEEEESDDDDDEEDEEMQREFKRRRSDEHDDEDDEDDDDGNCRALTGSDSSRASELHSTGSGRRSGQETLAYDGQATAAAAISTQRSDRDGWHGRSEIVTEPAKDGGDGGDGLRAVSQRGRWARAIFGASSQQDLLPERKSDERRQAIHLEKGRRGPSKGARCQRTSVVPTRLIQQGKEPDQPPMSKSVSGPAASAFEHLQGEGACGAATTAVEGACCCQRTSGKRDRASSRTSILLTQLIIQRLLKLPLKLFGY